jgi:O-antigen/teichoic acid export membrane protein
MISFPAAAAVSVLAPHIVAVLSGREFAEAVPVMRLSAPLVVLMGYSSFVGMQVLFTSKGDGKLLKAALPSAGVCIALNLLLAPRFAQLGSTLALLAAEICSATVLTLLARRNHLEFRLFGREFFRYPILSLVAGVAMYAASRPIRADLPALAAGGAAGMAFYLSALVAMRDPLIMETLAIALRRLRMVMGRSVA